MKITNLTPHDIVVVKADGTKVTFKASGVIARVSTTLDAITPIDGIPVVKTTFGDVDLGCDIHSDTMYIVSAMVLSALKSSNHPNLNNFVAPNTARAVRDNDGRIVGVPGFTV